MVFSATPSSRNIQFEFQNLISIEYSFSIFNEMAPKIELQEWKIDARMQFLD